jgi:hypothetical protein
VKAALKNGTSKSNESIWATATTLRRCYLSMLTTYGVQIEQLQLLMALLKFSLNYLAMFALVIRTYPSKANETASSSLPKNAMIAIKNVYN